MIKCFQCGCCRYNGFLTSDSCLHSLTGFPKVHLAFVVHTTEYYMVTVFNSKIFQISQYCITVIMLVRMWHPKLSSLNFKLEWYLWCVQLSCFSVSMLWHEHIHNGWFTGYRSPWGQIFAGLSNEFFHQDIFRKVKMPMASVINCCHSLNILIQAFKKCIESLLWPTSV